MEHYTAVKGERGSYKDMAYWKKYDKRCISYSVYLTQKTQVKRIYGNALMANYENRKGFPCLGSSYFQQGG